MTIVFEDLALIAKQIATFPATAALKKELGLTDDQLEQVGFHHKDRYLPVAQRRLTMLKLLNGRPNTARLWIYASPFTQFACSGTRSWTATRRSIRILMEHGSTSTLLSSIGIEKRI